MHLSPTVGGDITVEPNAVLGLAREGYRKYSVNIRDVARMAAFPGTWRVAADNIPHRTARGPRFPLAAWLSERLPKNTLQRWAFGPDSRRGRDQGRRRWAETVRSSMTLRSHRPRMIHVLNSPSPAATSRAADR